MKNKLFLTSFMVMSFLAPAIAEEFPQNGLMQENKTYDNAAISINMDGVYEGEVDANAEFVYNIVAGKYLPASSDETVDCLAGSFCSGLSQYVDYSENSAQGIESCPNGFGNSATGSTSDTQCYRACDIANMGENGSIANIAHAATLTGNDYYGDGTDTCVPATCVNGWHRKQDTLATVIGNEAGTLAVYLSNSGTGIDYGPSDRLSYGVVNKGDFAADYGNKGKIHGRAICSTRGVERTWYGNNNTFASDHFVNDLTDETGQEGAKYCWCKVDGYAPLNGTLQSMSSPWVFLSAPDSWADRCEDNCAYSCAIHLNTDGTRYLAYRGALLGSVSYGQPMCEANTINITWNDASAEDIAATGAATTVYEGDIKTPLKAITKPGKTFVGWKFVKPQQ